MSETPDPASAPLPGVAVTASVQGMDTAALTVVTDRAGNAVFRSAAVPVSQRGSFAFTVRNATLAGYTYLPAQNRLSSASLRR